MKAGVAQLDRGEYTEYGDDSQETFWPTSRRQGAEGARLAVYTILSERYASGETDVTSGHDEHQP